MFFLFLLLGPDVCRRGNLGWAFILALSLVTAATTRTPNHALASSAAANLTGAANRRGCATASHRWCLFPRLLSLGFAAALLLKRRGRADLTAANEAHGVSINRWRPRAKECR